MTFAAVFREDSTVPHDRDSWQRDCHSRPDSLDTEAQMVRREAARFDHVRNVENRSLFVFRPLQVADRIVTLKGCLQTG